MKKVKNNTEKLCSFYISDWHLVTMILPYINKEVNEKAKVVTFLENNIEENIHMLISKLNLKNEKKVLGIDWKSSDLGKNSVIEKKIEKTNLGAKNIILIKGNKKYIEKANDKIDKILKKNTVENQDKFIKIINCYEVTEFNGNIHEILDMHDRVLNTSGEKRIEEVFEGYTRIDSVS